MNPEDTVQLIVAMSEAEFIPVGPKGITLGELPNYDPGRSYALNGRLVSDEDTPIMPGDMVLVADVHDNG